MVVHGWSTDLAVIRVNRLLHAKATINCCAKVGVSGLGRQPHYWAWTAWVIGRVKSGSHILASQMLLQNSAHFLKEMNNMKLLYTPPKVYVEIHDKSFR